MGLLSSNCLEMGFTSIKKITKSYNIPMLILYQGFAKEIAARYNRDPYNMLEKIGKSNFRNCYINYLFCSLPNNTME